MKNKHDLAHRRTDKELTALEKRKGVQKMLDWRKEFEFDSDSAQRIADVIEENPMSLQHCAEILEAVAPLCTCLTTRGFLRRMEALQGDLLNGNYTLRPAPGGKDTLVLIR